MAERMGSPSDALGGGGGDARCDACGQRERAHVASIFGALSAGAGGTVRHGFDPDDFCGHDAAPDRQAFRMLYAGSLYQTRSPEVLLAAFRMFLERVPGARTHARLEIAGRVGPFLPLLEDAGRDGTVRYLGMLPHAEAMGHVAAADVNVVLLPNIPGSENDSTTKIYECLGSGRAILAAVPPNGAAANDLRGFDGVRICRPDDADCLATAMTEMYASWLEGTLTPHRPAERLQRLTREAGAERLAGVLLAAAPTAATGMGVVR